jgi:hypothetical protein
VLTFSRSTLTPGATASYTCNPGYEFVGTTHICRFFVKNYIFLIYMCTKCLIYVFPKRFSQASLPNINYIFANRIIIFFLEL